MTAQTEITRRLDDLHDRLPQLPANVLELTRASARRANDTAVTVADHVGTRIDDAGQTIGRAARTAYGQSVSAARRAAEFAANRRNEATGQIGTQAKVAADTVAHHVEEATDDASAAIDPQRPLSSLTKDELYEKAQTANIERRSSMTKRELVDALS